MRKRQLLWASCALIAVTAIVVGVALKPHASLKQSPSSAGAVEKNGESLIRSLQGARIVAFTKWSVGESENDGLLCIVRAFDQDPKYEGAGVKLSIFNQTGAMVHEDYFGDVHRIYSSYALRQSSPQLILEVDYGGSASFLKMLDYRNGKVMDLMDAVKPNSDFTISAEIRPQLRSGITPAVEPDQILLTEGIGLASPAEKNTEVFRYKGGAYRYVGEFSQQKVDDYIEELMKQPQGQTKTEK